MILSDKTILENGKEWINPFNASDVQPSSYELHIADTIKLEVNGADNSVARGLKEWITARIPHGGTIDLKPSDFILASTTESVSIPNDLVAKVEGKSSWARMGLLVHVTAGYVDPGFRGNITLEVVNLSHETIQITPGEAIAQLVFEQMDQPVLKPYGHKGLNSHYQDSVGTVEGK